MHLVTFKQTNKKKTRTNEQTNRVSWQNGAVCDNPVVWLVWFRHIFTHSRQWLNLHGWLWRSFIKAYDKNQLKIPCKIIRIIFVLLSMYQLLWTSFKLFFNDHKIYLKSFRIFNDYRQFLFLTSYNGNVFHEIWTFVNSIKFL